jgi:hypothetical protein
MVNNDATKIPKNDWSNDWDTLTSSLKILTTDENYKAVGTYIIGVVPISMAVDDPDQNSWEFNIIYNLQGQATLLATNIAV